MQKQAVGVICMYFMYVYILSMLTIFIYFMVILVAFPTNFVALSPLSFD